MGQRFVSRDAMRTWPTSMSRLDDAAAVYPDHDIVMRDFDGPLTVGDFVSKFAEAAEGHGGLPTYLRLTLPSDTTKLRRLLAGGQEKRPAKPTSH